MEVLAVVLCQNKLLDSFVRHAADEAVSEACISEMTCMPAGLRTARTHQNRILVCAHIVQSNQFSVVLINGLVCALIAAVKNTYGQSGDSDVSGRTVEVCL